MPIDTVPLDVFEIIIEILANLHLPSVKACSLVNHSFRSVCSRHIFDTIAVHRFNMAILLFDTPEIARYIRHLSLDIKAETHHFDGRSLGLEVFERITGLRSLKIHNFDHYPFLVWDQIPLRPVLSRFFHLASLTRIFVCNVKDFVLADFIPCTNLEDFGFSSLEFTTDHPTEIIPSVTRLMLRKFSAGLICPSVVAHILAAKCTDDKHFIDVSLLTDLSANIASPYDARTFITLLNRCQQVRDLKLKVSSRGVALADALNHNLSLKTLKDVYIYFEDCDRGNDLFYGLVDELQQINSENAIESLHIFIYSRWFRIFKPQRWSRLDNTFSQTDQWPNLRKVLFSIALWDVPYNDYAAYIANLQQTYFPRLSRSTSLMFEFNAGEEVPWINADMLWSMSL
ncbi:hypothetical protein BDN70DRAFT_916966 [Pholiota conissans]|uniref:F-box domain-containing protein n=1 Tax=Pholiota conissans TaxID=109636 RepID=A0A9P5ZCA5_9AGAR|nr:hypothetical protein BDN70DRAFT_916966 [Pholiota conissans]